MNYSKRVVLTLVGVCCGGCLSVTAAEHNGHKNALQRRGKSQYSSMMESAKPLSVRDHKKMERELEYTRKKMADVRKCKEDLLVEMNKIKQSNRSDKKKYKKQEQMQNKMAVLNTQYAELKEQEARQMARLKESDANLVKQLANPERSKSDTQHAVVARIEQNKQGIERNNEEIVRARARLEPLKRSSVNNPSVAVAEQKIHALRSDNAARAQNISQLEQVAKANKEPDARRSRAMKSSRIQSSDTVLVSPGALSPDRNRAQFKKDLILQYNIGQSSANNETIIRALKNLITTLHAQEALAQQEEDTYMQKMTEQLQEQSNRGQVVGVTNNNPDMQAMEQAIARRTDAQAQKEAAQELIADLSEALYKPVGN